MSVGHAEEGWDRGNFLRAQMDLHETTQYKVKGKKGCSEPWYPQRGVREGCPTSPILFNIYHQVVMDTAERRRGEIAGEERREVGIPWHCVPGSRLQRKLWEKFNSEARGHHFTLSLFADDTTVLGEEKKMQAAVPKIKETMEEFEENNNSSKEEKMIFGDILGERTRVLGCWMGNTEDIKQRKVKKGKAWFNVKQQLKRSRLHKRTQARIVQACLKSAILFDCHARVRNKKDIKSLQSWMDRSYRHIWSNKREAPLRQMQREGTNMQDVRNHLGIRSKIAAPEDREESNGENGTCTEDAGRKTD